MEKGGLGSNRGGKGSRDESIEQGEWGARKVPFKGAEPGEIVSKIDGPSVFSSSHSKNQFF